MVRLICEPYDPVQDVEAAVRAEREEVVGIDDGRDGGLAEEEELRDDADGLEDDGERPDDLCSRHIISFPALDETAP